MSTTLTKHAPPQLDTPPIKLTADWTIRLVGLFATIVSITAYIYFAHKGLVLAYKDSVSHLQIAERVIHSPTAGFAQLGGVWLPLPHLLMLPFIWVTPLYNNGFAGSIVSMASYVIATLYVYKIVFGLTKARIPAIAGMLVFALNPNILYMQSTPMTELLLFATILAMVYYVQKWIETERHDYLFAGAFAAALGCMTRYEAWVLTFALSLVVAGVTYKRHGIKRADGTVFGFAFLGWAAIVGWVGWNWIILGNPLNFQTGEYSKPSLWVGTDEPSVGSWSTATKTYWYAVLGNLGLSIVILTSIGIVALALSRKLHALPALSLTFMIAFFIFALEQGQRPLHVMEVSSDLYNVRFGLFVVLISAISIGYLANLIRSKIWSLAICTAAVIATLALVIPKGIDNVVTVREPIMFIEKGSNMSLTPASNYLYDNYHGGKVLMESFGNETILFDAEMPLSENIYEGSYKLWMPALIDPDGNNIEWIIMRHGKSEDKVYEMLFSSPELDSYTLVFHNDVYFIYERK